MSRYLFYTALPFAHAAQFDLLLALTLYKALRYGLRHHYKQQFGRSHLQRWLPYSRGFLLLW